MSLFIIFLASIFWPCPVLSLQANQGSDVWSTLSSTPSAAPAAARQVICHSLILRPAPLPLCMGCLVQIPSPNQPPNLRGLAPVCSHLPPLLPSLWIGPSTPGHTSVPNCLFLFAFPRHHIASHSLHSTAPHSIAQHRTTLNHASSLRVSYSLGTYLRSALLGTYLPNPHTSRDRGFRTVLCEWLACQEDCLPVLHIHHRG
ncbi:hypothetical protein B0T17DRAFT_519634 [Bombardia bombarda]|uniref:Secreted protein n=1 Tax=Bombardia bombarda TaxID=252184 RepID=A0AA40CFK4_9PEZI|nr:hypothetical protein B0T17DRAFT_519634 [Bombardia bombarda]